MLVNIKIENLYPHPDNPRKDLGDLTELAASIKANGIMQNLTVVPWFSSITGAPADDGKMDDCYRVVIGHRRLAAAKLAGLETVPCIVADMDDKTQMSTMLLENMQRNDLTLYEQAHGFQMMLNFGETVNGISDKTGLSESTVRRRVKLLELDQDKFQESVERGASLQDYAELEKINDIELRNSVLEKIGTSNFSWELNRAINNEKAKADREALIAKLDEFAEKVEDRGNLKYVRSLYSYDFDSFEIPDDADSVKYYYHTPEYGGIILLAEADADEEEESSVQQERKREQQELEARRSQLEELSRTAYMLRYEFIKNYSAAKAKKHAKVIMEFAAMAILDNGYVDDEDMLMEMFDIELDEDDDEEFTFNTISDRFAETPEKTLLILAYCSDADSDTRRCYSYYDCIFRGSENLNSLYDILIKLGYEMSDEEKAMKDGTHELYKTKEIENE